MKIRIAWSVVALFCVGGSTAVAANPYGSASMLPLPTVNAPVASVARHNPTPVQGQWSTYTEQEEVAPPPANINGDYEAAMQDNGWGDGCTSCGDNGCYGGCGYGNATSYWTGGVYGLLMTRDRENNLGLSYTTIGNQVLHSRDADLGWNGGVEARLGHFCADCTGASGWEVVYWTIFSHDGFADANITDNPAGIRSDLSMENLDFGATNSREWFGGFYGGGDPGIEYASVRIRNEFHNLEFNLLSLQNMGFNCNGPRFTLGGGLGVRWFRFDENMLYGADQDLSSNDPLEEAYYNIDMTNDLIGLQMAAQANYAASQRFNLFSELKFGLYANYMQQSQRIYRGDGLNATINNGPNLGQEWDFSTDKTDVAFLGEIRMGARWQITQRWSAVAAYRAMAVTGVAFTTEQVPVNMGDLQGARNIDSNGSLILHGIQVGAEFKF